MIGTSSGREIPAGDGVVSRSLYGRIVSKQLFYPIVATASIFILLALLARRMFEDPIRLLGLLQLVSLVFFLALLFRLMLRPASEETDRAPEAKERSTDYIGLAAILLVAVISYIRSLSLFFFCDDFGYLEQVLKPFKVAIWPEFVKGQDGVFYRPLAFVSFFLDFHLWRQRALGFHLTSLFLHLVTIAGVFILCRQIGLKQEACRAATLLFAVMPVGVQTVSWTSARFDQLAAAFGIWSITSSAVFRRTGRVAFYWTALALFVLSVLSKENAYIVPVIWIALEIIQDKSQVPKQTFSKRAITYAGYFAMPVALIIHRLLLFGDIGGYRNSDAPLASHLRTASIFGLLVRAPAETQFGYDLLQPGSRVWLPSVILTAAIFLMLAFWMKTDARSRRLVIFASMWIFVSAAPAHFYFWGPDPGLFVSRTLYFGSIGLAILIAVLLDQAITAPKMFYGCAGFVALLLFAGAQHNISAWQHASRDLQIWLTAFGQEQPAPPPNVTYYIKGVPLQDRGVPFFAAGLESAVRSKYSWRQDIHVVTEVSPSIPSNAIVINYKTSKE